MSVSKIADITGVSIATVSNVINNKGRVSRETAELVQRTIREENFIPRKNKRRSYKKSSKNIVLAVADDRLEFRSNFHLKLVDGMHKILDRTGYSLILSPKITPDNFSRQTRNAAAVILVGFSPTNQTWHIGSPVPIIWTMNKNSPGADLVREDNYELAQLVANYLINRGHKNIGYINDKAIGSLEERASYLYSLLAARGNKFTQVSGNGIFGAANHELDIDTPQLSKLLDKLLKSKSRPTAIFVPGDRLCVAVYSLLREKGIEPRKDIEIISCNNEAPFWQSLSPRPATIDIKLSAIGSMAAEMALWRLKNPLEPFVTVQIRPVLLLPPDEMKHNRE